MPRSRRIFRYVEDLELGCLSGETLWFPSKVHRTYQFCLVLRLLLEHNGDSLGRVSLRSLKWNDLPVCLYDALTKLLAAASLRRLEFEYVMECPAAVFRHISPGLKSFRITHSGCPSQPICGVSPIEKSGPLITVARPKQLIIQAAGSMPNRIENCLIERSPASFDISHLTSLYMVVRNPPEWHLLQKLLQHTSGTLEHLYIAFQQFPCDMELERHHNKLGGFQPPGGYERIVFDLNHFCHLRKIEFRVSYGSPALNAFLGGLSETLSSLPEGSALAHINFFGFLEPRYLVKLADPDWNKLDRMLSLATPHTAVFQNIRFCFSKFIGQPYEKQLVAFRMTTDLLSRKLPMASEKKMIITERTTRPLAWPAELAPRIKRCLIDNQ
ncbi:hypothetical protein AX15_005286 [Amanita polypyramis BW_CC]|nr:hypothetical protein AX15_005286 [Amanita polypyramis BW_CC]